MKLSRRTLLQASVAGAATLGLPFMASAEGDTIKLGSVLDLSGIFDAYGKPMDMAAQLAVDEINADGGLLGKKVEIIGYDTQSDMALYTQYAKDLVRKDKVDVVQGGILSASREAIRPTLRKAKTLYFYNVQYEGGVCDRNVFVTGVTPAQQIEPLVPYAMKKWGKKIYVLAADYNYGQITAKWLQHYAKENGGEVIEVDFFPLDVSDFGATITKIQEAKPDMVISALVGGAHISFYRQWASSGMNKKIPMASTTLGVGGDQKILTAEEGDGILVAYTHSKELDTPQNKAFLAAWEKKFGDTDSVTEISVSHYQGIKLWAEGVRKAGSLDRDKVIEALESGLSMEGPGGMVTIDPQTHHAALEVHIMEIKDQKLNVLESMGQKAPLDTQQVCDLKANPGDTTQYEITVE